MSDHDRLEQSIYIHLTTTREPLKRGLAGTGQSRRRERSSAASIAKAIVSGVRINHRFERDGADVDDAELIDLLAERLWKVPEAIAKDLVGVDAYKRDDAKSTITRTLLLALTSKYKCTFFMPDYRGMGPSVHSSQGH